MIENIYWCSSK